MYLLGSVSLENPDPYSRSVWCVEHVDHLQCFYPPCGEDIASPSPLMEARPRLARPLLPWHLLQASALHLVKGNVLYLDTTKSEISSLVMGPRTFCPSKRVWSLKAAEWGGKRVRRRRICWEAAVEKWVFVRSFSSSSPSENKSFLCVHSGDHQVHVSS